MGLGFGLGSILDLIPVSLDLAVLTITAVLICLEWQCSGECRGSCEIFGSLP